MSSVEERIFDTLIQCLQGMVSPSLIEAEVDGEDTDKMWTMRDTVEGYLLPWSIVKTHDQNLEPVALREGDDLQYDTPALFIEYGNIGEQYTPSEKDIPTFMEYPSLGFIREMTPIFLRVLLFNPDRQMGVIPRITHQIARARQDIRKCIGDSLREMIPEVYQVWVGEYVQSSESFYTDTAEFIIPVEAWWKYDYREIDREPTATVAIDTNMEDVPQIATLEMNYGVDEIRDNDNNLISTTIRDTKITIPNIENAIVIRKQPFLLGAEEPSRFKPSALRIPDTSHANYSSAITSFQDIDYYANQAIVMRDSQSSNNPAWIQYYDGNQGRYIDLVVPGTTEVTAVVYDPSNLTQKITITGYQVVAGSDTIMRQRRVNGAWQDVTEDFVVDMPVDITDIEMITITDPITGMDSVVTFRVWTDNNGNRDVEYQVQLGDGNNNVISDTPNFRYPYYPTMMPESVYDDGNSPEQNLERKIRQTIQQELDKGSSRKYFQGVNNVHSGPLSPKYLEVDNLPMICLMFDKSAIDVGQPVSGRGVGFRTANTIDESLSFTAMVYATADRKYTDPYQNVKLVDNVLSDLREFVIDYEQFDNVSGTVASIIGPISFPRIAQDVAGELLFIGVFEFFIRYRPGG